MEKTLWDQPVENRWFKHVYKGNLLALKLVKNLAIETTFPKPFTTTKQSNMLARLNYFIAIHRKVMFVAALKMARVKWSFSLKLKQTNPQSAFSAVWIIEVLHLKSCSNPSKSQKPLISVPQLPSVEISVGKGTV